MLHEGNIDWQPDEEILLATREHPFLLFVKIVIWTMITIVPFVLQFFLTPYLESNSLTYAWYLIRDTYLLLTVLGLFILLVLYYLNVHIVSNKRIIDIDQLGVTKHHTVETYIDRVQDVSAEVHGFWGQVFNYGEVYIQSAGDIAKIVFENIPYPKNAKRIILDALYRHEEAQGKHPHT